ncbi:hypothetical protein PTE30175_02436 [Pandoraea terrae]|uniref:Uncharacterized protein n=1 Tax=Pandoraea terrae TaxID=1537710 RepID=A0A5E4VBM3_9BURK|nr:hypothetical protein [Pandoraea terrae]VVE08435.1 hypothetical protein PTE30175_02436 [Pandoraea terrae]
MNAWSHLVEAEITGILVFADKKCVEIKIRDSNRNDWLILAEGVDDVLVEEMRLTNIVDRVWQVDASTSITERVAQRIYYLLRDGDSEGFDKEWSVLQAKLDAIRRNELSFCEIEPVYGATVMMLAKHIKLEMVTQHRQDL